MNMWNNYNSNSNQYPSFNNNYSGSNFSPYQNQMQQTRPMNTQTYQNPQAGQAQSNIYWVSGRENARSTQLQPNSSMILLDNETNKFYIKTTDNIGLGKIRVFNYTEELDAPEQKNPTPEIDLSNYVTKQQLQKILITLKGERQNNEQSISTTKQSTKQPIIIKK